MKVIAAAAVVAMFAFGQDSLEKKLGDLFGPAKAFDPQCPKVDAVCEAWQSFRTAHPFPYQAIESKRLADGSLAIFLFEPPPVLLRSELDGLLKKAFGADLHSLARRRWQIGPDGWLEDVLLHVDAGNLSGDPLSDALTRHRIGFLHLALFGTTAGATLPLHGDAFVDHTKALPDIAITGSQLRTWVSDASMKWRRLDRAETGEQPFRTTTGFGLTAVFASSDRSLVTLSFPGTLLRLAPANPAKLDPLRVPFRLFALASDAVLGAMQEPSGQVLLVGRARTTPLTTLPPLRFETFRLVASQPDDELAQSYERTSMFAGKMQKARDWAPAYLSPALYDTELGALLNITDQLLKSWSQGGTIEYEFFNYPVRGAIPFPDEHKSDDKAKKPRALSVILGEKHNNSSVLFNWNTAGVGVLTSNAAGKVLVPSHTGSLPVTYGSDVNLGKMQTGHLFAYENAGYAYFRAQRDANLARVVSYTVIYQFCRALAAENPIPPLPQIYDPKDPAQRARHDAAAVVISATAELIAHFRAGKLDLEPKEREEVKKLLADFTRHYPGGTERQLAALVADRMSPEVKALQTQRANEARDLSTRFVIGAEQFNAELNRLKADEAAGIDAEKERLEARAVALRNKRAEVDNLQARLEALMAKIANDPIPKLQRKFNELASEEGDIDAVYEEFQSKFRYEPAGCIKTPSTVVSWSNELLQALFTSGGTNLSARTLRFEPSATAKSIQIVETPKGRIIRYPLADAARIEANAARVARLVEHEKATSIAELEKAVGASTGPPPPKRPALHLNEGSAADPFGAAFAKLEDRPSELVSALRAQADAESCCIFITSDSNGVSFAASRGPKPPPTVHQLGDSRALQDFVGGNGRKGKPLVFLNTPPEHVESIVASADLANKPVSLASLGGWAEALGTRRAGVPETRLATAIRFEGLDGRTSLLRGLSDDARRPGFLAMFHEVEQSIAWRSAKLRVLDEAETSAFMKSLGWNEGEGSPSVVVVSLPKAQSKSVDVGVTALFDPAVASASQPTVGRVVEAALDQVRAKGGSPAQFGAAVRDAIKRQLNKGLVKLNVFLTDGGVTTLFSLRFDKDGRHIEAA